MFGYVVYRLVNRLLHEVEGGGKSSIAEVLYSIVTRGLTLRTATGLCCLQLLSHLTCFSFLCRYDRSQVSTGIFIVQATNQCSSGIVASVITMDRYIAHFGNAPDIKGAVVSTFNGQ